jgi:hypothetical protein
LTIEFNILRVTAQTEPNIDFREASGNVELRVALSTASLVQFTGNRLDVVCISATTPHVERKTPNELGTLPEILSYWILVTSPKPSTNMSQIEQK